MKEILVNWGILQKSAVIIESGEIVDVLVEHTPSSGGVGNIYKGTVDNVVPGMQSAFIDLGLEKNGFIFSGDVKNSSETDIRKKLKKGQDVIVQVVKEAQGVKGARVTTELTVPGHRLVMMPQMDYVGVSKKISSEEEKERLRSIVQEIKQKEHGYIVRTDAVGCSKEELLLEINYLTEEWEKIQKLGKIKNAPALLHNENELLLILARDYFDETVDKVVINDKDAFEEFVRITSVVSAKLKDRITFKEGNIFIEAGIESKFRKLLERKVWLDNGAYLIIDYTEALTVIDVNTGKFTGDYELNKTIVKTNILAAKEIARQLRLRAIGGIIVIDFIDMESDEDRKQVLEALEESSKGDKIKTNILGFAPLGLVELTRKKTRLSLSDSMQRMCPYCEGDGRILNEISVLEMLLGELRRLRKNGPYNIAILRVNPHVLSGLEKYRDVIKSKIFDTEIYVREDAGMHIEDYNIRFVNEISDNEGLKKLL